MIRVHLTTLVADREPIPYFLRNITGPDLENLWWTDPLLGVTQYGWWNESNESPPLALYQRYTTETLTVDVARRVVVSVSAIEDWTAEEIAAYKKPIQDALWAQIKAERDGALIVGGRSDGGVLVSGHWFHSDITSRVKWLALAAGARDQLAAGAALSDLVTVEDDPDDIEVHWKTMSGAFVPVSIELALGVVKAIMTLDARLFKVAEIHRAALVAAYNPAIYDYTAGWPLRYVDTLNDPTAPLSEEVE